MTFAIENDALQEALRIITRLAPPVSGNIAINSTGKKIFIISHNETAKCEINVPSDVSGKEQTFAVSLQAIRDATKGRGKLEIEYSKTLCKIRSNSYKCELPTVDAMEIEDTEEKKSKTIKIDADQARWLRSALAIVALKPTQLISSYMPLSIKMTDKGVFVACYDPNHMAFINSSEITGSFDVRLPIDMFTSVLDAFDKSGFNLELSQSSIYVSNKLVKVSLALPQEDENDLKISEVMDTAKSTKAAKGNEISISKDECLKFLDNARAVATKERSEVKIDIKDQKMKLEVITSNGSIKTSIKVDTKKSITALIDFEFLDEAIRKSAPQVIMKIVDSEFIAFKMAKGTVVVSLNQSD